MAQDKWLNERLAYIRGLKAQNDQQRLMLMLAEKGHLVPMRLANSML